MPKWYDILSKEIDEWQDALNSGKKYKVLIATSIGAHLSGAIVESMLAVALTLRNAEVHILLCDEALPACQGWNLPKNNSEKEVVHSGPQKYLCKNCFNYANKMFQALGIPIHYYSELLDRQDLLKAQNISETVDYSRIRDYEYGNLAVGEHAFAGALRFYARGDLEGKTQGKIVLRKYLKASLLTAIAVRKILREHRFDCAVFHHGIYVPQGVIGEVCRSEEVRVVNWDLAYRKQCFIFSHDDTYHHTLMSEPVDKWENLPWTDAMEEKLMQYLGSRILGRNDWIRFHEKPNVDFNSISKELHLDLSKPCIGLLTNVIWDAQIHYPKNAFRDMLEWLHVTIDYFIKRPELQLVIRVHPAEIKGILESQQKVVDEINRTYPKLPNNIMIIPPESDISTYEVMLHCNAVLIYGTKTGVELSSMSVPIIVAGEAWIRNKGITRDAQSPEDYLRLLDGLPLNQKLNKKIVQRARKYAFHFFFRRMIPVQVVNGIPKPPYVVLDIRNLNELKEGNDRGLDVICEGILRGTDFIYPEECMS
ncbi:MAG: capsule biosynthesis protein [Methanobacteriota archaeon]